MNRQFFRFYIQYSIFINLLFCKVEYTVYSDYTITVHYGIVVYFTVENIRLEINVLRRVIWKR